MSSEYGDVSTAFAGDLPTEGHPGIHWWREKRQQTFTTVFSAVEHLNRIQEYRESANIHFLRLYSNRAAAGLSGRQFSEGVNTIDRIRMNVVKSCIDAAVAQIATNRPRPMYLPVEGGYKIKKKAKRLGNFVNGLFHHTKLYQVALDVFRDACIFGTGFLKVYEEDGEVCVWRVFPGEIVVDDAEAVNGEPRTLHHVFPMDRELAAATWSKYKNKIMEAGQESVFEEADTDDGDSLSDMVTVIESWHLDSGIGDGRHTVSFTNCTPVDEKWSRGFPIIPFHWTTVPRGFFGIGAAEELSSIQMEINYIAQKIQKLMTLATSMVWKEKGSYSGRVTNKDWDTHEYTGKPPVFQTTAAVSAEYFHHLDRLYQRAFEIMGISQLSAQSKKPAGLDSGEALRVYLDVGTQRFMHVGQRWEQWFLDVGEEMLACARSMNKKDFSVLAAGKRTAEMISYKEVALGKDEYAIRVWPSNLLPDTPAGKVETMAKMVQAAPGTEPYIIRLFDDVPDLENIVSLMSAPLDIAEDMVSAILEDGRMEQPWPQMNLNLTRDIATRALLRAYKEEVPEDRLAKLRKFIQKVDDLQSMAEAAAVPAGPPGMGPPGAPPPGGPPMLGPSPQGPPQMVGGPPQPPPSPQMAQ